MFKTNSPVLATGLCFLIEDCLEQGYTLSVERRGRGTYYTIYLNTDKRSKIGNKGMHLAKNKQLVKKTYETRRDGYLYDLTTKSGRFVAGVGKVKIHNSPRRGFEFVTRKITDGVAKMKKGKDNVLVMGNLETKRDWGFAGDYVEAMWLMLQQEKPGDYVIATGENHTIREFIDLASKHAGLTYEIVDLHNLSIKEADNEVEKLRSQKNRFFVVKHPIWYRPAEVNSLLGDASKAEKELGWKPKMSFQELVKLMVQEDIKRVEKQAED
ncbi:MAG: GDP-mannose 4,6-dehydratase [Nanoarchaeota archaeon]|nr:GDP-mannose 4,6-dehydratase [Nanoarchaeota archaeon]